MQFRKGSLTEERRKRLERESAKLNPEEEKALAEEGFRILSGDESLAGASQFGARVYFYGDGVVLIKQTRKSSRTGQYVIDIDDRGRHKERHGDPGDDRALGATVRLAGQGRL